MTSAGAWVPNGDGASEQRTQLSFLDMERAYFNAKVHQHEPPVFVNLSAEDPDSKHTCAQLLRHMYGPRMVADGLQEECSTLLGMQGSGNANLFHNKAKNLRCSVYGDDFTSCDPKSSLDWFDSFIRKPVYSKSRSQAQI